MTFSLSPPKGRARRAQFLRPTPLGSPPPMGGGRSGPSLWHGGAPTSSFGQEGYTTPYPPPSGIRGEATERVSGIHRHFEPHRGEKSQRARFLTSFGMTFSLSPPKGRARRAQFLHPTPLGSPPPMGGGRSGPSLWRGGSSPRSFGQDGYTTPSPTPPPLVKGGGRRIARISVMGTSTAEKQARRGEGAFPTGVY